MEIGLTLFGGELSDTVLVSTGGKVYEQKVVDSTETICGANVFFVLFFLYDRGLPPPAQFLTMRRIYSTSPERIVGKEL